MNGRCKKPPRAQKSRISRWRIRELRTANCDGNGDGDGDGDGDCDCHGEGGSVWYRL